MTGAGAADRCTAVYGQIGEYLDLATGNFGESDIPLVGGIGAFTTPALVPGRYFGYVTCYFNGPTRHVTFGLFDLGPGTGSAGSSAGSSWIFPLGNSHWTHQPVGPVIGPRQ